MKPILFNTEMVKAILDGRKSITRRAVKPPVMNTIATPPLQPADKPGFWSFYGEDGRRRAPYQPGDILYVRETWVKLYYVDPDGYTHYEQPMYYYAADGKPDTILFDENGFEEDDQRIRWRPSIHMPKEAGRLFLRVTDVRAKRLHDMTVEDFIKEGCTGVPCDCNGASITGVGWFCTDCMNTGWQEPPFVEFWDLWDSTIKKADLHRYGWAANPWVWVIEFERISKKEAFANT